MAYYSADDAASVRSEAWQPGAKRKKLAGYLKAANELRQSYFSQDGSNIGARDFGDESGVEGPGAFPDAAVVRSGNEEMILFPSYARRHVKRKTAPPPAMGEGQMSEQEYWRREFERHQDDNAIVDVDVRGWIYTPHRGPATRKHRVMIGLARQLVGLPRPGESSQSSSRAPSPQRSKREEEQINREAQHIVKKGEHEERYARRGAFSEVPRKDTDDASLYNSRGSSPDRATNRLSTASIASSTDGDSGSITPLTKRSSMPASTKMSHAELTVANNHLLNRLKPFMAYPLENTPISAFFYNESCSRQHTVYTDDSGHFTCRAALEFVPTHVRVLAAEKLSATEEVIITSPKGVSMISDIDDTIKHSAISAGAREIFRNAFVRELGDLTIEGVREWYNTMHDMGIKLHYVSNSPWQMYPVLTSYFKLANLPKGSFHMKQYSGMLQGIFEPVAERKKANLDKIMRDFPDRKFILVGDSGEADLEVYTDTALDNPGRILGIFIRDVTTPVRSGYFDSWSSGGGGGGGGFRNHGRQKSADSLESSKRVPAPNDVRHDDADLRAAITASLADMEEESRRARRGINPDAKSRNDIDTPRVRPDPPPPRSQQRSITASPVVASPEEDLIDFSDEPAPSKSWPKPPARRSSSSKPTPTSASLQSSKLHPSPPPKPSALRSPSPSAPPKSTSPDPSGKTPPPRPRKPSSAIKAPSPQQVESWTANRPPLPSVNTAPSQVRPSPLSQVTAQSPIASKERPPLPARRENSVLMKGFASTHKALVPGTYWQSSAAAGQPRPALPNNSASYAETPRALSTVPPPATRTQSSATIKTPIPPPPPRTRLRTVASYSTTSRKTLNRLSGGWDDGDSGSLPGSPGEAGMSKKEFMWAQRWARAKSVLERQGVTLRSWRVGSDVADVCVRLAEAALREIEREGKEGEKGEGRR